LQGRDGYSLRVGDWRVIYELDEARSGKDLAILPMNRLKRLMEAAEMLADVKAYDAAKRRLDRGEEKLVPLEITERRLAGERADKVWREHRGMTQAGHTRGGIATLKKLAEALRVDLDRLP
jgi:hypothetical protein